MRYPYGYHLYTQPNLGSETGGSGLLIGADDEGLVLRVFHSKERARALLERYRPHMDAIADVDATVARVDMALLPERSGEPDAVIAGIMAEICLAAIKVNAEEGRNRLILASNRPRVSICFLDPSETEGLCLWRARDDWHAAHFLSRADAAALVNELIGLVPDSACEQLARGIAESRLPSASDRPMARFRGHAAAVLGLNFENDQFRQAGN
jgi:hypothetical protein